MSQKYFNKPFEFLLYKTNRLPFHKKQQSCHLTSSHTFLFITCTCCDVSYYSTHTEKCNHHHPVCPLKGGRVVSTPFFTLFCQQLCPDPPLYHHPEHSPSIAFLMSSLPCSWFPALR